MNDTFKKAAEILAKHRNIPADSVKPETAFADLGLDSLDVVDLMMVFEEEFGVTIEMNESIKTVGDVVKTIETLKS